MYVTWNMESEAVRSLKIFRMGTDFFGGSQGSHICVIQSKNRGENLRHRSIEAVLRGCWLSSKARTGEQRATEDQRAKPASEKFGIDLLVQLRIRVKTLFIPSSSRASCFFSWILNLCRIKTYSSS